MEMPCWHFHFLLTEYVAIYRIEVEKWMLTPGNVVKFYKKEVLENLVRRLWECKARSNLVSKGSKYLLPTTSIYGKKSWAEWKKSLRHMIGGNVVNSFFCNFIKGEMKIKSIKILKTSYLVLIPNQVGQLWLTKMPPHRGILI